LDLGGILLNEDLRILVVDDFATMRRIIRNLLRDSDLKNVTEAEDGEAALKILQESTIDLVITDWSMPNMTGIDLLRSIRADEYLKTIPVLLVTAEAKREQILEAVTLGVNGYIIKPFTAETLKEKLEKILLKTG